MKRITFLIITTFLSVMFVSSAPTTGLQFTGVATSYIDLGPQVAFSPTQFTIEAWVNYQTLNDGYIMSNEGFGTGAQGFTLHTSGSKIEFVIGANTVWNSLKSQANIAINTWYHVAVTYNSTTMNIYINGVFDNTMAITSPMITSTQGLSIGEGSAWKGRRITGKMGDVRFWNVVRSQVEISGAMSSSLTGTETGLVSDWKMNEGTGFTVADATGNQTVTITAALPWFIPTTELEINVSQPLKGLTFNGLSNSLIDLGNNAAITSPTEFTIEALANLTSLSGGYILASEGYGTGAQGYVLKFENGKVNFNTGTNTTWTSVGSPYVTPFNTWTHIAVTYSSSMIKLYVNGLEVTSLTSPSPMIASTQNLIMGDGAMWRGRGFRGQLGYVRMWSVVKTKQEIRDNANIYVTGTETNLLASWNNDVNNATTLYDIKSTYPGVIGTDVQWFGSFATANPILNTTDIETLLIGRTLKINNKTTNGQHFSIYSITGQKVLEDVIQRGCSVEKQLTTLNGSFILKCIAEDGSSFTKKLIIGN